MNRLVSFKD